MLQKFEGITQVLFSKTHKAMEETEKLAGNILYQIKKIWPGFQQHANGEIIYGSSIKVNDS